MLALVTIISTALALASSTAADLIAPGVPTHFFSTQNPSLLFAPTFAGAGATLQAANPGDGSASDITALTPVKGSGTPTQITLGDLCVSANGVVPGTATQVLKMADCDSNDPTQLWIVLGQVSNADGNCVTLGRAAKGVDVTLSPCSDDLKSIQSWEPFPAKIGA
ncbi:hypothetical protein VTO73DRAFT_1864 [Trametes versicolor]